MLSSATPAIPARGSSLASLNRQTRRSASGARRGASVTVRAEGKKEAEGLFAKLKAIVPSVRPALQRDTVLMVDCSLGYDRKLPSARD